MGILMPFWNGFLAVFYGLVDNWTLTIAGVIVAFSMVVMSQARLRQVLDDNIKITKRKL